MLFTYKAIDKNNNIQDGEFEAENVDDVLRYLGLNQLKPISIEKPKKGVFSKNFTLFQKKVTEVDKIFLLKYLILLLKSGTDTLQSINLLLLSLKKPSLHLILSKIKHNLEQGLPFYKAFENDVQSFSPVFVSLIKAGESSGTLVEVLESLQDNLEREYEYKKQIKSSLTYPIILVFMSLIIATILIMFVLPNLAKVILTSKAKLPAFSRNVFTIGLWLNHYLLLIYGVGAAAFFFIIIFFNKTKVGIHLKSILLNRVPLLRGILYKYTLGELTSTLSLLLRAGVPLIESIEITAQTISHYDIKAALTRIAQEDLVRGASLGESFKGEKAFPLILSNLVSIAEKTGKIDEVTKTLGEFYSGEVNSAIKGFLSLLEPLILVFMGLFVGFLAISIIVPIYQLISTF